MGLYVNPRTGTKKAWLALYATSIHPTRALVEYATLRNSGVVPVVWVGNESSEGAIGVAYDVEECRRFLANPLDEREKKVYLVATADLIQHAGISADGMRKAKLQ